MNDKNNDVLEEIGTFVTTGAKVIVAVIANYCLKLPLKLLLAAL